MTRITVTFDVEKGNTDCANCPFYEIDCVEREYSIVIDCQKYDLSTLSPKKLKEE